MVAFRNTRDPPAALLQRIRRGEVGGVILFSENLDGRTPAQVRALVDRMQHAARTGGNPPLLIATDQEGGEIRRMQAPPEQSAREMGAMPLRAIHTLGRRTGVALRRAGIDVDLAPDADVGRSTDLFLADRVFGTTPARVRDASVAFAAGLQSAGVAATAKHYPGLGRAGSGNTDAVTVTIAATRAQLDADRAVYDGHVRAGTRLMMLSSAAYPAYDAHRPAVASRRVIHRLRATGFTGVTISDDLTSGALRPDGPAIATMATAAGVDVLLYAATDGRDGYARLLADARSGRISRGLLNTQVRRIIALKRWLASRG